MPPPRPGAPATGPHSAGTPSLPWPAVRTHTLDAVMAQFRTNLAEAIAARPVPLTTSQRAQLSRQARAVEDTVSALNWQLDRSWRPIQDAFGTALHPPPRPPLDVDRTAYRHKTRHRNRRTR